MIIQVLPSLIARSIGESFSVLPLMKCGWEERAPLKHMIIDQRRANPILHLIQLIVLEYD